MTPIRYQDSTVDDFEAIFPRRRENIIRALDRGQTLDVLVIGGGVHGAVCAHLAAFNGLRVALLERADYAGGASSHSSKIVYGGVPTTKLSDVLTGLVSLRGGEDLFDVADHLAIPQSFLVPVWGAERWRGIKLRAGLWLRQHLLKDKRLHHRWRSRAECPDLRSRSTPLCGGFEFGDGMFNDTRLVIERILAARQEGALCLNYAEVVSLNQHFDGCVNVGWRDHHSGASHELRAGVVINCAGQWVPNVGRLTAGPLASRVAFARSSHLLFDKPWTGPALCLPLAGTSRVYFVCPHFAGTLVGTAESLIEGAIADPQPTPAEIEEILEHLKRDLPEAGLDHTSLHYCFCGIRTLALPQSPRQKISPSVFRRAQWHFSGGVLSLVGGEFAAATVTAYAGFQEIARLSKLDREIVPLDGRKLPGAGISQTERDEFMDAARPKGVPELVLQCALQRLGRRALKIAEDERGFELVGQAVLRGEVLLALRDEQAMTIEDLMCRRLDLEYLPGHGLDALEQIAAIIEADIPGAGAEKEQRAYCARVEAMKRLCAPTA